MKNYAPDIASALVTAITTVQSELSLVTIAQGDFARIFADNFADTMPMVLVAMRQTDPPELGMSKMVIQYPFRVRVFRQQNQEAAEDPYALTMAMACRIWEVLCTSTGVVQNRPDWASTLPTGCKFVDCRASSPSLDNEENMFANAPIYRANCAWIDLIVNAQSFPT